MAIRKRRVPKQLLLPKVQELEASLKYQKDHEIKELKSSKITLVKMVKKAKPEIPLVEAINYVKSFLEKERESLSA